MPSVRLDAIVLDAAQRQALVTVRSLGRSGVRVGAFDVVPRTPAFKSRWCAASGVLSPFARDPDQFFEGVLELLDRHAPRVLMVAHDGTIEVLRKRRGELETHVAVALAPEAALEMAVSKARTLSLAQQLGIAIPRGVLVQETTDLPSALAETGLPAVLKPVTSWVEHGEVRQRLAPVIAVDRNEAKAMSQHFLAAGTSVLLQEWLPGKREAVWLFYAEDRFWARFAHVAHRTLPLVGGSWVMRESIPLPRDIVDPAEELVAAARLTGVCEVEFRRDAHGLPRLMEINPRLSASAELAVRAGIDFPVLFYSWASGYPLKTISKYRSGVRMRWLGGDIIWLRDTLRSRGRPDAKPRAEAVGAFLADFLRPTGYDYLALSDLRPALTASADFVTAAVRRALDREQAK